MSVLLATAISCGDQSSEPPATTPEPPATTPVPASPVVATVTVNLTSLTLQVGQRLQLTATTRDASGNVLTGRALEWSSSDAAVANVSSTGLVSALAAGGATVTATVESKSSSATITVATQAAQQFNLSRELLGTPRTVSAFAGSVNVASGEVTILGGDARRPLSPFTFDWGDGIITNGFFNQSHTYRTTSRNYVVRVTAHYSSTETDYIDVLIRFTAVQIVRLSFPSELTVTIPDQVPTLTSRQPGYSPQAIFLPFDDSFFGATLTRGDVEYVLSQAAAIEFAILEGDVERVNGEFRQVVLRDPNFGGAYSLWYTTPVAFGASGAFFQGTPGYSSLFHEMGHNLSLNAPAAFRYGGRIDGSANAVFSEAVAQMFQHTAAYEIVNNSARYGIPSDLSLEIANSARSSAQIVRASVETYVAQGKPFITWNDSVTSTDETFGTFMTVARHFLVQAERAQSYIVPLTRTMRLLRMFNQDLLNQYAPRTDSVTGSTFRATLMVAALSYGFQKDLRAEFRESNFLIDDSVFDKLMQLIP